MVPTINTPSRPLGRCSRFRVPISLLFRFAIVFFLFPVTSSISQSADPWPAIRKIRIQTLLPDAMKQAGIDAWLVVCRENANDPLALHIGGENAGQTAAFLFFLRGDGVESVAISPAGEARALSDVGVHDRVITIAPDRTVWDETAEILRRRNPKTVAINTSSILPVADGLSHSQRLSLEKAAGTALSARFVASEDLVAEWLSVKCPEEIEIIREAGRLTVDLMERAYRTVVPGKTRDSDIARWIKARMAELGVGDAWTPDQNPNINSGPDRGHSHSTDRIIQPGDFIQMDFGIRVHGIWCTDFQRFAYVLEPGRTKPPESALRKWEQSKKGNRIVKEALKPGARGWDVDRAQRLSMRSAGSLAVPWNSGHPVGYWAHDPGPTLGGGVSEKPPESGNSLRILRPGMLFAFDGFYAWPLDPANPDITKTLSVEEMAVVTATGSEYLIPVQEDLILIPSP